MRGSGGIGVGGIGVREGTGEGEGFASVGWSGAGVSVGTGEAEGAAEGDIVGITGKVALPCATASVAREASCVASGTLRPHSPKSARLITSGRVLCAALTS